MSPAPRRGPDVPSGRPAPHRSTARRRRRLPTTPTPARHRTVGPPAPRTAARAFPDHRGAHPGSAMPRGTRSHPSRSSPLRRSDVPRRRCDRSPPSTSPRGPSRRGPPANPGIAASRPRVPHPLRSDLHARNRGPAGPLVPGPSFPGRSRPRRSRPRRSRPSRPGPGPPSPRPPSPRPPSPRPPSPRRSRPSRSRPSRSRPRPPSPRPSCPGPRAQPTRTARPRSARLLRGPSGPSRVAARRARWAAPSSPPSHRRWRPGPAISCSGVVARAG